MRNSIIEMSIRPEITINPKSYLFQLPNIDVENSRKKNKSKKPKRLI